MYCELGLTSDRVSDFGASSRTRVLGLPVSLDERKSPKNLKPFTMGRISPKNSAIITMEQAISKRAIMSAHLPCAHQPPRLGPSSTNTYPSSYETEVSHSDGEPGAHARESESELGAFSRTRVLELPLTPGCLVDTEVL